MSYLIDSDWAADHLRGRPPARELLRLLGHERNVDVDAQRPSRVVLAVIARQNSGYA